MMFCHSAGASPSAAACLAAVSATKFHSLGTLQNLIFIPWSLNFSTSPRSASHRSRFLTGALARVTQPLSTHFLAHSVAPLTVYSESVAMTSVSTPSPGQNRNRRAAMTARSSARLLVCSASSPNGPLFSRRPEAVSRSPDGPHPCQKAHAARGPMSGWPLSRQAPSVRMRTLPGSPVRVYLME